MAILSCSACLACWINGRSLSDNRTSDGREFSLHYNFRVQRSVGKPLRFNRRRAASLFGRARIFFCFQFGDARGFQSQVGYARAEDGRRIDAACYALASILAGVRHTSLLPILSLLGSYGPDSEPYYFRRACFHKIKKVNGEW